MTMNDGSADIVVTVRSCSWFVHALRIEAKSNACFTAASGAVTTSHPLLTQVKRLACFSLAGGKLTHSHITRKTSNTCLPTFPSSTMLLAVFSVCHSMDQGVNRQDDLRLA